MRAAELRELRGRLERLLWLLEHGPESDAYKVGFAGSCVRGILAMLPARAWRPRRNTQRVR